MNKTAVELMLILVVGSVIMIDDKLNHNFPKVLDIYSRYGDSSVSYPDYKRDKFHFDTSL